MAPLDEEPLRPRPIQQVREIRLTRRPEPVRELEIEEVVELPTALPLRWSDSGAGVRSLRLSDKVPESEEITGE